MGISQSSIELIHDIINPIARELMAVDVDIFKGADLAKIKGTKRMRRMLISILYDNTKYKDEDLAKLFNCSRWSIKENRDRCKDYLFLYKGKEFEMMYVIVKALVLTKLEQSTMNHGV